MQHTTMRATHGLNEMILTSYPHCMLCRSPTGGERYLEVADTIDVDASNDCAPMPALHGVLAVAACACLLLVAFTICSLTGLVFLAAFGIWSGVCAADLRRHCGGRSGGGYLRHRVAAGLWSFVAALAGIVLAAHVPHMTAI